MKTTTAQGTIPSTGQSLAITLTAPDASNSGSITISGTVSSTLISQPNVNIALIVDISGSAGLSYVGTPVGDLNGHAGADTVLDAEIAGALSLVESIRTQNGFPNANIALIAFNSQADAVVATTVSADNNSDGIPDIEAALVSLRDSGGTNYKNALLEAISFFQTGSSGQNFVYFLSDGEDFGANFSAEVDTLRDPNGINATIRGFAINSSSALDDVDLVDDNLANGSAQFVSDPGTLAASISGGGLDPASIARVEILVNGVVAATIPPSSLVPTALGFNFNATLNGLRTNANDTVVARVVATDPASTTVSTSQVVEQIIAGGDDVIVGGTGNDKLFGDGGNETISGGDGNDRIEGGTGWDELVGGASNDWIVGGRGADKMFGGEGFDTAAYGTSNAAVSVNLATGQGTGGDAQGDTLSGIEHLFGSSNADTLVGAAGWNRLDGGGGNDWIVGGAGGDSLIGGAGVDTAAYGTSNGGVTVDLAARTGKWSHAEGDWLTDIENVYGSRFADSLLGDAGANQLNGAGGGDWIVGGGGADTLAGGAGSDTFVFRTAADSGPWAYQRDTILDFVTGDKISLASIDANWTTGGNQAFVLDTDGSFSAGEIRQTVSGGNLLLEMNTDADSAAEMSITLTGFGALLNDTDFVL